MSAQRVTASSTRLIALQKRQCFPCQSFPWTHHATEKVFAAMHLQFMAHRLHGHAEIVPLRCHLTASVQATDKLTQILSRSEEVLRLSTGPLIHELRTTLHAAAAVAPDTPLLPKLLLYSGHDTTLMPLAKVVGAHIDRWPPYCSYVVRCHIAAAAMFRWKVHWRERVRCSSQSCNPLASSMRCSQKLFMRRQVAHMQGCTGCSCADMTARACTASHSVRCQPDRAASRKRTRLNRASIDDECLLSTMLCRCWSCGRTPSTGSAMR